MSASESRPEVDRQWVFPVLLISKGTPYLFSDWERVTRGTRVGLKKGAYRKMFLVDSTGYAIDIVDAEKAGPRGGFWWRLIGVEKVRLRFEYRDVGARVELAEVKRRVLRGLRMHRDVMDEDDYQAERSRVESASSIGEIISLFMDTLDSKWWG